MAEFTVIETQEQLDAIIGERLKRDREAQAKKYEGYMSAEDIKKMRDGYEEKITGLNKQIDDNNARYADFDKQMAEKDSKIKAYEIGSVKTKIAGEFGLDLKAVDFLKGENEEDIRKSAETLKTLIGNKVPPMKTVEPAAGGVDVPGLAATLNNLNLGGY